MQKITRSIVESKISFSKVDYNDGKLEEVNCEPLVFSGKIDKKSAQKLIKNKYGKDDNYIIKDIKYRTLKYEMSVEKFIANAEKNFELF